MRRKSYVNKERSELNKTMQKFTEVIMAFDFKKEYKEFYMSKNKPEIVNVPKANYIAVRGKGNPTDFRWWVKVAKSKKLLYDIILYSSANIERNY